MSMLSPIGTVSPRSIDLQNLPIHDREAAWRTLAGGGFEVSNLPEIFTGVGKLYELGPLVLTDSIHPHQTFERTASRTRKDQADGLLCSIELSSGFGAVFDGEWEDDVGSHKVTLWDMSRPSMKLGAAGRTLCLSIERDTLKGFLPFSDSLHGLTLGEMGPLFTDHVNAVVRSLPKMSEDVAPGIGRATLELLAACIRPSLHRIEQARPAITDVMIRRADHFIRGALKDPNLSPESVGAALGVSRSSLYRVFEPLGGVSGYIRDRRLDAAHAMLANPHTPCRVGDVAYRVGFKSESHFTRAFRTRFGAPPGEVRRSG